MTAPMTLHGSTLPTYIYIVKCTFNCSYQLDNTLTADLKKKWTVDAQVFVAIEIAPVDEVHAWDFLILIHTNKDKC
jgi:hypothetical protein